MQNRSDEIEDTAERGPVVELELADLLAPRAVDGPPRCKRKRPPR